ncbi:MAG: glycosyltransferase [Oscillatoriales cyanobacterium]|nr:MAG: glycosyltransferase [Oscillatoriales cyanobacterium]
MPSVSVVIPAYNGEHDIHETIHCLLAQDYPSDRVEFLIVDNHSRDRTPEVIAGYARDHDNLVLLREDQIQSSYAARNTGIRHARYDLIAFTDADCLPEPQWLRHLVVAFRDPEIGLVAGQIEALTPQTLLERFAEHTETLSQKHTLNHSFCPYGQTANLAVRREIFERIGLFRPYLTTGGDADFCWRALRETHTRIELAPTAIVRHRHRSTLTELRKQWYRYGVSNRYLHQLHGVALTRSFDYGVMLRLLLRWLLKEVPRELVRSFQGRGSGVGLWSTPISLYIGYWRSRGQDEAELPEKAREIATGFEI